MAAGQGVGRRVAASRDNVAPIFAILILVLTGVVLICAAIGLADVARNDSRLESQRHAALQAALDELRPCSAIAIISIPASFT